MKADGKWKTSVCVLRRNPRTVRGNALPDDFERVIPDVPEFKPADGDATLNCAFVGIQRKTEELPPEPIVAHLSSPWQKSFGLRTGL